MAYLLFYRRKDLSDFSTTADDVEGATADATTVEAENNTNADSSDSEQDSGNAAEGTLARYL